MDVAKFPIFYLCASALNPRKRCGGFLKLIVVVVALLLAACGGGGGGGKKSTPPPNTINNQVNITGRAAFDGATLQGAVIALGQLDITQTQTSEQNAGKFVTVVIENFQPIVTEAGTFSFTLPAGVLKDDTLYNLSVQCPALATEQCPLAAPLNVVISGKRLTQGSFTVSILTELVYQRLRYYVAAGFDATALLGEIRALARMVLANDIDGNAGIDYEDLLQWQPDPSGDGPSLRRPQAVSTLADQMKTAEGVADLQHNAQSLFAPIAAHLALPGSSHLIAITDHYAYVVTYDSRLLTIDIAQPLRPTLINEVTVTGIIQEMHPANGHLYITYHGRNPEDSAGLHVFSLANPSQPIRTGGVTLLGEPAGLTYQNGIVYVADVESGLHVVDVSQPEHSTRLGGISDLGRACGVAVNGRYAYVTDQQSTVHTLDVSTPTAPTKIHSVYAGGRPCNIELSNGYAFIAAGYGGIQVLSLAEPTRPALLASEGTLAWSRRLVIARERVFLAASEAGLQMFDVADPALPRQANSFDTPDSASDVALQGDFAFVTDGSAGLQVIDIGQQPIPLQVGSVGTGGRGIAVSGERAYMLSAWPGLQVVDISVPDKPEQIATMSYYANSNEMAFHQHMAYIADGDNIKLVNMSDPDKPSLQGEVDISGWANGVVITGNLAVASTGATGMQVLDVSVPEAPQIIQSLDTDGYAGHAVADGQWVYIADGKAGVKVVDISEPLTPIVTGTVNTPGNAHHLFRSDNYLFVADGDSGLQVIDILDRKRPKIIGFVNTPGYARRVVLVDNVAYIADEHAGVQMVDVRNPSTPILLASARTRAGAVGIAHSNNLVLAATHFGLEILRLMPLD